MNSECNSTNPLTLKMMAFGDLPEADCAALNQLVNNPRTVPARTDLIREGAKPSNVFLVVDGFACRYKILPTGKRHIMAYLLPGDFCDLHVFILEAMDHNLGTLSACSVVEIPRSEILALLERPALARAVWMATMADEGTLREWLVNLGSRPAEERVAHLLCELLFRLRVVGMSVGDSYELPLTQNEIADTMGLSAVHVNRVIQRLRKEKLITLKEHSLVILDIARLTSFAGFTPNYLHLKARGRASEAGVK